MVGEFDLSITVGAFKPSELDLFCMTLQCCQWELLHIQMRDPQTDFFFLPIFVCFCGTELNALKQMLF